MLMRSALVLAALSVALYFYDKELLVDLGNRTVNGVSHRANAVYIDYHNSLNDLYSKPEKKYAFYSQVLAVGLIFYFTVIKRSYDPSKKGYGGRAPTPLSKAEQQELLDEWTPKPLIDNGIDPRPNELGQELVLTSRLGSHAKFVDPATSMETEALNFGGFDFLGMSQDEDIRDKCKQCLTEYGCGSCGPRGFYGTSDKHLELELAIKDFFQTEEAIVYSDAASTMSSIIPAFAKRGDVIVADIAVSESALAGIELSRSTVKFFKHNDVADLNQVLESLSRALKRKSKPLHSMRRYIVVEGLYRNYGDFAPLKEILAAARKHKFRVVLDDSFALGTVGPTGRGSLERAGLTANDVDFLAGSLATSLGSVGGFCTGSHVAVDHQRLAGSGYCFSASSPPFTCVAAIEALSKIESEPARLQQLKANVAIANGLAQKLPNVEVISDPESPLIFLQLADSHDPIDEDDRFDMEQQLQRIVDSCLAGGSTWSRRLTRSSARKQAESSHERLLVVRQRYVYPPAKSKRPKLPRPSIRISVSSLHSEAMIESAFATLAAALQ